MAAWEVMIGLQFLFFGIAGVMTWVWMMKPADQYDEMLEALSKEK